MKEEIKTKICAELPEASKLPKGVYEFSGHAHWDGNSFSLEHPTLQILECLTPPNEIIKVEYIGWHWFFLVFVIAVGLGRFMA